MARNNLFLGTASGSVGDVTVMRRLGQQVSRVRVRTVANPRSAGQAAQRLKLNPITNFYSAYSTPLERSYEGLNKSQSYSALLKENIVAFNGPFLVKGSNFVPGPFIVSRGSLPVLSYEMNETQASPGIALSLRNDMVTMGDVARELIAMYGLQNGDQITVIYAINNADVDTYYPGYYRWNLDTSDTTPISSVTLPGGLHFVSNQGDLILLSQTPSDTVVGGAFIVSRKVNSVWKRSTQRFVVAQDIYDTYMTDMAYSAALDSYKDGASANLGSDVYLNNADTDNPVIVSVTIMGYVDGSSGIMRRMLVGFDADGNLYAIYKTKTNSVGVSEKVVVRTKSGTIETDDNGNPVLISNITQADYKAAVAAGRTVKYKASFSKLAEVAESSAGSGQYNDVTIGGVVYNGVTTVFGENDENCLALVRKSDGVAVGLLNGNVRSKLYKKACNTDPLGWSVDGFIDEDTPTLDVDTDIFDTVAAYVLIGGIVLPELG